MLDKQSALCFIQLAEFCEARGQHRLAVLFDHTWAGKRVYSIHRDAAFNLFDYRDRPKEVIQAIKDFVKANHLEWRKVHSIFDNIRLNVFINNKKPLFEKNKEKIRPGALGEEKTDLGSKLNARAENYFHKHYVPEYRNTVLLARDVEELKQYVPSLGFTDVNKWLEDEKKS